MHANAPHPLGRKVGGEGSGGVVARFGSTSIRDISEKTLTGDANKNRLAESLDLVKVSCQIPVVLGILRKPKAGINNDVAAIDAQGHRAPDGGRQLCRYLPGNRFVASEFIVSGVPRVCCRMYAQPRAAIVENIARSPEPPVTSLMIEAPASTARRAVSAW